MSAAQWHEVTITLTAQKAYGNPYMDVSAWVDFVHDDGTTLRRPAYWDGDATWCIRFASTKPSGTWRWTSNCTTGDPGLRQTGTLTATPGHGTTRWERHGFWHMSAAGRHLVHADGAPGFLVGDTAWGLPWRATPADATQYATDRQAKGFNAALLMAIQPDMRADGPTERTADEGFARGFADLPQGRLTQLLPEYFQAFDILRGILLAHDIVPVLQPVFMGFGWKGLDVAGPVLPPTDYARFCRYLVARYGAGPVVYLVGGDGTGLEAPVAAGGKEIHAWDCYHQPTGNHYRPHAIANAHQGADWLDFQWCQTGHQGEHMPERVAEMRHFTPTKAVANGEPSYENTTVTGRAAGWWQGSEAWVNLCAGGTMGVVYGAGSLWQWAHRGDEPGQSPFFLAPGCGWREALAFEGSTYVGLVGKILADLPIVDSQPDWEMTLGRRGLRKGNEFFLCYSEDGGPLLIMSALVPLPYRVVDPRTGETIASGVREPGALFIPAPEGQPVVFICQR
jgi:Protein of unknown function (DUF4038)/Domain of unknown function (DUF5060)